MAQLTRPEVILGWVDVRDWDPSLVFVMLGATSALFFGLWLGAPSRLGQGFAWIRGANAPEERSLRQS